MKYARNQMPRREWPKRERNVYQPFQVDPNQPVNFEQNEEEKGYNYGNNAPVEEVAAPFEEKPKTETTTGAVEENRTTGTSGGQSQEQTPSQNQGQGGSSYDDYVPSDTVLQAEELLAQYQANQPGAYESQWQEQIQGLIDQITNRDKFSYNLNEDALYRQYADQYAQMGKMAMMDTMGQAAAMTGGYGSSYGQSVGQQAYQGYLQQLNDKVPELYGMAFDQYQQEGQDLLNQYGLLTAQEEQAYGRYRDQVSDYYAELDRLTEDARYKAEDEYGKYIDERNYEYQQGRDAVSDEQWQAEFDESKRQYEEQMDMAAEQWAWEKAQAERAQKESGKGGSSSTGASGYELDHVASMSADEIVAAMKNYNAEEDDTGLEAFLDDLVNTGRIDEATADKWYSQYKSKKYEGPTDTDVPTEDRSTSGGHRGKESFTRKVFTYD